MSDAYWDAVHKGNKLPVSPHDPYAQALDRNEAEAGKVAKRVATGMIYILATEHAPNICKVGVTTRSAEHRAIEISAATGALPFTVFAELSVVGHDICESMAHDALSEFRIGDKEIFSISPAEALPKVRSVLADHLVDEWVSPRDG